MSSVDWTDKPFWSSGTPDAPVAPAPLTAGLVRSTVERFLTEQGWELFPRADDGWYHVVEKCLLGYSLGEALDVALRNEGGEA